jgi:hypothetical protein
VEEELQERQALVFFTTTTEAVQISSTGDYKFLFLLLPSPATPTVFTLQYLKTKL